MRRCPAHVGLLRILWVHPLLALHMTGHSPRLLPDTCPRKSPPQTSAPWLGLGFRVVITVRGNGCGYYSAPNRGAEYCDERVCLCVCVCLSVIIYSDQHVRSSPNFLCMLHMTVARSFSGGEVIRYVLPVLWITSYLLISQGCSTSPPSWSAVHTQPWAWL